MATKDLCSNIGIAVALAAVSVADNTVQTGTAIDMQGFESLVFGIQSGALADADATFAVKLQHGDLANGTDMADVDADDLIGAAPVFNSATDDNAVRKLGYRGTKRFVRLVITPASNAAAAAFSAFAIRGHARYAPVP